jgi:hypothetical protein
MSVTFRVHGTLLVPPTSPPDLHGSSPTLVPVVPAMMPPELASAFEECEDCVVRARAVTAQQIEFDVRGPHTHLQLAFTLDVEHAARLWARATDAVGEPSPVKLVLCPDADVAIRMSLARFAPDPAVLLVGCRHFAGSLLELPEGGLPTMTAETA